jgi:ribonuclease P/MRP protein subunit POP5
MRRVKRRYLALQVVGEQPVSKRELMDTLWTALLQLYGEYGASQAGLKLIEFTSRNGYAIIRCWKDAVEMVRASIASITEIEAKPATIHVLRVSGTLKALRKKTRIAKLETHAGECETRQ